VRKTCGSEVGSFGRARRARVPCQDSSVLLEKCGFVMRMKKRRRGEMGFIYADPLVHLVKALAILGTVPLSA
jgi:hypothetical protein